MDQELKIELSFDDEDAGLAVDALASSGATNVKQVRQRGLVGIETVVLAILAVQALVNVVIKLSQLWKCGLIVDARGAKVVARKDCNLQSGSVLILSKDGTQVKLERPTEFDLQVVIEKAAAALKRG